MSLHGYYQGRGQSQQQAARLEVDVGGRVNCREVDIEGLPFEALTISPRIGNSRRFLSFPDGGSFETDDNDTVDRWISEYQHPSGHNHWIHRLEATGRYVGIAALATLLLVYAFLNHGLPWLSIQAADAIPLTVAQSVSRNTLGFLDDHVLAPSQLPVQRRQQLSEAFARLRPADSVFTFGLELRHGQAIGANAFALPDGTIVLTDALVEMATNDEQIFGVLLHEIAHVEYRHGLRSALQKAGLATLLVLVAGDVSSANSFLLSLPALLVETDYSRDMETEADLYAVRAMRERRMDPEQLLAILQHLEQGDEFEGESDVGLLGYLSTHPLGEERLAPLRMAIED